MIKLFFQFNLFLLSVILGTILSFVSFFLVGSIVFLLTENLYYAVVSQCLSIILWGSIGYALDKARMDRASKERLENEKRLYETI